MAAAEPILTADALADTYAQYPQVDILQQYQDYLEVVGRNPDLGSTAVANQLDLPRERVRAWMNGSRPDAVRAVQRAEAHGWVPLTYESPTFQGGLNVLVAWVFSGGSIGAERYVPQWAVDDADDRGCLEAALDVAGVEYTVEREGESGRATEYRPTEDGSVLGRVLAVLGAPVGPKHATAEISLPDYLDGAPDEIRREFAVTYFHNRATQSPGREVIHFREERSAQYQTELQQFFEDVTGESLSLSEKTLVFPPEAVQVLEVE